MRVSRNYSSESKEKIHQDVFDAEITKHRGPDGSGIKVFDLNDKKISPWT